MTDARKRRKAKQARRDARRDARQRRETSEETELVDEVREALDSGEPMDLLGLAGMVIEATTPRNPLRENGSDDDETVGLADLVDSFIGVPIRETTALLAALAELLVDDDVLRDRCRREVAQRDDVLPPWLTGLAQARLERAVRMTHVLGDGDELLVGVRFSDGQSLTCAAFVDHNFMSFITDAFVVPTAVDEVLELAERENDDPDVSFVEMSLADAGAWLLHGLDEDGAFLIEDTDTWPACRPLVHWLAHLVPEGGSVYEASDLGWPQTEEFVDRFFASLVGMRFADPGHRRLLHRCIDENNSDPLRWSAARLHVMLDGPVGYADQPLPVAVQLDAPDLLRAFVPYAHAESKIRLELTAEALGAIDECEDEYRQAVLDSAADDEGDD